MIDTPAGLVTVSIDVPAGDDGDHWETVWTGEWPYLPAVGSTIELRTEPGGPVRYLRVAHTHAVLWADTEQNAGWAVGVGGGLTRSYTGRAAEFASVTVYALPVSAAAATPPLPPAPSGTTPSGAAPSWPPRCSAVGHSVVDDHGGRVHTPVLGCAGCAAETAHCDTSAP